MGLKLKLAITFNDTRVGEGRDAEHGGAKRLSFMGESVPLLSVLPPSPLGCGYNGQRKTKALKCRTESPSVYSVLNGNSRLPDDASLTERASS